MVRQDQGGPRDARGGRPRYAPPRKVCQFCTGKLKSIDYKETDKLRNFIADNGKIDPRRRTGTCAQHQRLLATAIKRARHLALLPYVPAHIRKTGVFGSVATPTAPQI